MFPLRDNIPTERFAFVTVALIVANVLMYFFFQHGTISLGSPDSTDFVCNLYEYGTIPKEVTDPGTQIGGPGMPDARRPPPG